MLRLRQSLLTMLNPSFHAFLLRRAGVSLQQAILAFHAERSVAGSDTVRLAHVGRGVTIQNPDGLEIAAGVTIGDGTELLLDEAPDGRSRGTIALGKNVKLGKRVQVGAGTHTVRIGDDSSIHNGCILQGSVSIGRYCLLSCNIFISSEDHFFDHRPAWLVRDQDPLARAAEDHAGATGRGVVLEDDCWIGWGAVIRRGVYIGKGAIIGANSVVTKDIAPYSINAGAPCRQIGERLRFRPARELTAGREQHWPYFYSGFLLHQRDLEQSLKSGVVFAGPSARMLLEGGSCSHLRVRGILPARHPLHVRVSLNGAWLQTVQLEPGEFAFEVSVAAAENGHDRAAVPAVLRDFNEVRLDAGTQANSDAVEPHYGIASVILE